MSDISDAYESAYTIMLNLNKTWVQKQGDFFVESPIILLYIPLYDKIKDNQQDNREYNQARNDNGRTFVGCF